MKDTEQSVYLGCGVVHDLLGGEVTLVAHKELVDGLAGVPVDFLQPLLHVVEGLLVGYVVDHDDAVGAAVVAEVERYSKLVPSIKAYA